MTRSLASAFATEKDLTFARPFNSAVFHFGGAIGDVYVASFDVTIGADAHHGAVASWGAYRSVISPRDGTFQLNAMTVEIINFPIFGTPAKRFSDLWSGLGVEGIEVDVYQNFRQVGSSTILQELLFSAVMRPIDYDPRRCRIELVSISEKYLQEISFPIEQGDFPNADVDDVGKRANQIYGTAKKIPCHAVVAGPASVVRATMTTSDTTVPIWDDFHDIVPSTGTVQIGNEKIAYTGKGGSAGSRTLTGLTRGSGSTPVEAHAKDDAIFQLLSSYTYLVAGHAMKAIDRVYIEFQGKHIPLAAGQYTVDLANTTLVSGKTLTTITFTEPPLVESKGGAGSLTDSIGVNDTIAISQPESESTWEQSFSDIAPSLPADASFLNNETQSSGGGTWTPDKSKSSGSYIKTFTYRIASGSVGPTGVKLICNGVDVMDGASVLIASPVQVVSSSAGPIGSIGRRNDSGGTVSIGALTVELKARKASYPISIAASKSGTVTKTGTVSLSGASSAEKKIGDRVLVDGQGYADDGSGTYTGTSSALIEKPADVIHHLARIVGGIPSSRVDATALAAARGDSPASYKFAGNLVERSSNLKELLLALGIQSRIKVDWPVDKLTGQFLKTSYGLASKTLTRDHIMQETIRLSRTDAEDLVNVVFLYYGRDWTVARGRAAFHKVSKAEDATAIGKYGRREQADRFLFDFVPEDNSTMAEDLRDFWLARLKEPARLVSLDAKLDQYELLPGDLVGITYAFGAENFDGLNGTQKFLTEAVELRPGSARERRPTRMALNLREVS